MVVMDIEAMVLAISLAVVIVGMVIGIVEEAVVRLLKVVIVFRRIAEVTLVLAVGEIIAGILVTLAIVTMFFEGGVSGSGGDLGRGRVSDITLHWRQYGSFG